MSTIGKERRAGRIAVVVNPRSGNGRTGKRWPTMGASLREAVGGYTLMLTEAPGHAPQLGAGFRKATTALSASAARTHNEVVNAFSNMNP